MYGCSLFCLVTILLSWPTFKLKMSNQLPKAWYLVGVVFPAVATSRQLVYSTVFHQVGEIFGFTNYGVLLGLCNVVVSAASMIQGPLVEWAQYARDGYLGPNLALFALTLPLFAIVYGTKPPKSNTRSDPSKNGSGQQRVPNNETSSLLAPGGSDGHGRPRALSDAGL
jgi:hypothetical protein